MAGEAADFNYLFASASTVGHLRWQIQRDTGYNRIGVGDERGPLDPAVPLRTLCGQRGLTVTVTADDEGEEGPEDAPAPEMEAEGFGGGEDLPEAVAETETAVSETPAAITS